MEWLNAHRFASYVVVGLFVLMLQSCEIGRTDRNYMTSPLPQKETLVKKPLPPREKGYEWTTTAVVTGKQHKAKVRKVKPKVKQRAPLEMGYVCLERGKKTPIWYYPDAYVSRMVNPSDPSPRDTIDGVALTTYNQYWQEEPPPLPASMWNKVYHVPADSIDSWKHRIIVGTYAWLENYILEGILSPYLFIYFSRRPSMEEFEVLRTKYRLNRRRGNSIFEGQVVEYQGEFCTMIRTDFVRASRIIALGEQLRAEPIVDCVLNEMDTGRPVPLDGQMQSKSLQEVVQ